MVVALDDCTMSVMTAPQNVPSSGVAAAFSITVFRGGAGERLEPVGHHRHAQQEQADAADDRNERSPNFLPAPRFVHGANIPSVALGDALVDLTAPERDLSRNSRQRRLSIKG